MSILPRASLLAIAVIALPLLGAGCSMPFQVAYIDDPSAEIRGIRYKLKRPAYSVGLQLDLKNANVYDRVARIYVAGKYLGCPDDDQECPNPDPVLSIAGKPADLCLTNLKATVLLTQNLSKTMTFEIRNDDAGSIIKTLLADSQLSVTVDDDGYLTSVVAKVDDQILPLVQAVAAMTVSMAKMAAAGYEFVCLPNQGDVSGFLGLDEAQQAGFQSYMQRHVSLAAQKRALEGALKKVEVALTTTKPGELKELLEEIRGINDQLKAVVEQLKIVSFDIPDDKYVITVDGEQVAGRGAGESNWIKVELTSGRK